jgi:hypothetical protein
MKGNNGKGRGKKSRTTEVNERRDVPGHLLAVDHRHLEGWEGSASVCICWRRMRRRWARIVGARCPDRAALHVEAGKAVDGGDLPTGRVARLLMR